eukprot:scaffold2812_cov172-Ochromonas_danica.AAC.2
MSSHDLLLQDKGTLSDLHEEKGEEQTPKEGIVDSSESNTTNGEASTETKEVESSHQDNSHPTTAQTVSTTTTTIDTTELKKVIESQRNLSVLSIGRIGAGTPSVVYCLEGIDQEGRASWPFRNGNVTCTFGKGRLSINDARGFRGNLKYDWSLLKQTISTLPSEQPIDMVILCLSFLFFAEEDENILYLLREFTTPAFRNLIRVVITHAPEGVVSEESKAMIAEKLSFLGNSPEEVLAEKVTFVDLISPLSFPSHLVETQEAISNKWNVAQGRLTQQLLATNPEESIKPNEIMAKSYLHQFYLVYKREIFIASTIVIILCLLYFIVFNWLWSLEQKARFNMCLNDLDSLAKNNTILQEQIKQLIGDRKILVDFDRWPNTLSKLIRKL